jgi:hypothetical protein
MVAVCRFLQALPRGVRPFEHIIADDGGSTVSADYQADPWSHACNPEARRFPRGCHESSPVPTNQ